MLSANTLQVLLSALGLKINPAEILSAWNNSKDALPKLAADFSELKNRVAACEASQTDLHSKLDRLSGMVETLLSINLHERTSVVAPNLPPDAGEGEAEKAFHQVNGDYNG